MSFLVDRDFINLRLPKVHIERVEEIAKELGIPKSRAFEMIIEDYLSNKSSSYDYKALFDSNDSKESHYSPDNSDFEPITEAVLMAGGIGSRLRPFTDEITKPMIPVHGKPILEHQVFLLRHYGVKNIFFSVCYKGDQIERYFGDGSRYGMNFFYLKEDVPMGTGYALRLLKKYELKRPFYMINADIMSDVNLKEFARFYESNESKALIALTPVDDPTSYGVARMSGARITEFVEKPKTKRLAPSNLINAGFYIIDPSIIDMVPNKKTMMEYDIFPVLAKQGELTGYEMESQWFDTGTPDRYSDTIENWQGFSWAVKNKK